MKTLVSMFLSVSAVAPASPAALAQCCGGQRYCARPPSADTPAAMGMLATEQPQAAKQPDNPYPLTTCPITGNKLGSMGDPVVKVYDGREVRFCCPACPEKFEKDLSKNLAKLDEAIVKDQLTLYPLDTSVVSGTKLPEKPVDWVYNNRLVRLAEETEKAQFRKDPARHIATLDKAVAQKQSKNYPLDTCPVTKNRLGEMGEPKDFVIAGRLIRLCCASCEKDVRKDPAKYIAMIDDARKGRSVKRDDKPAGPAALYTCPMHPEVTSDQSDARCPKCGMKLVPKK